MRVALSVGLPAHEEQQTMITIHNELTIEPGDFSRPPVTLWLVGYGAPDEESLHPDWPIILAYLRRVCALQGWLLECGDDPYQENSLEALMPGGSLSRKGDNA